MKKHRAHPPLALAYHGIEHRRRADDPLGLTVRPRDLEAHVRLLRRWHYELVTFGELARRAPAGAADGCAALTFDDGLADNCTTLLPLLQALGAPATLFVVTGWLGAIHPDLRGAAILSAAQVQTLASAGIEIGAHSYSHRDLTALPLEEARADLETSRAVLEDVLQRPVTVAAYPFGRATAETRRAAAAAGFLAACRSGGKGSWADPFDLPRQNMNTDSSLLGLWLKRDQRYDGLMNPLPMRVARRASRAARRIVRRVGARV
jgi:peptidoglycan/xylan/chitin deacetylase (PgdA/CDA1 family)